MSVTKDFSRGKKCSLMCFRKCTRLAARKLSSFFLFFVKGDSKVLKFKFKVSRVYYTFRDNVLILRAPRRLRWSCYISYCRKFHIKVFIMVHRLVYTLSLGDFQPCIGREIVNELWRGKIDTHTCKRNFVKSTHV